MSGQVKRMISSLGSPDDILNIYIDIDNVCQKKTFKIKRGSTSSVYIFLLAYKFNLAPSNMADTLFCYRSSKTANSAFPCFHKRPKKLGLQLRLRFINRDTDL